MSDLDRDTAQVNMPLDARYGRGGIDGALQRRVRLDQIEAWAGPDGIHYRAGDERQETP